LKIIFFDKIIFEGTKEECEIFRGNLSKTLSKLDDELEDTYPMKQTDTDETYFESLKILNPFIYETLSYLKEIVGDYFIGFYFYKMGLAGVGIEVYENLETRKKKTYALSFIYFTIVFGLENQTIWKIED